jgi:hypothetical protein
MAPAMPPFTPKLVKDGSHRLPLVNPNAHILPLEKSDYPQVVSCGDKWTVRSNLLCTFPGGFSRTKDCTMKAADQNEKLLEKSGATQTFVGRDRRKR